jgi:uncharacterized membrane protein YagU involved in acid resistance
MTTAVSNTANRSLTTSLIAGALAGLAGGAVFGMMMALMGMLPMVAMLVGSESAAVGFIVHMAISAFIGAVYGVPAGRLPQSTGVAIGAGAANGIIWWVLGALIMMPLMLGMGDMVFVIGGDHWMSLIGHVIFGVVTGLVFLALSKRS